jgi:hypothetical protein
VGEGAVAHIDHRRVVSVRHLAFHRLAGVMSG